MAKWVVRAERGEAIYDREITDQLSTTVKIGAIHKEIPFKPAREVAYGIKESLIKHGWNNVRVVRIDPAPAA